MKFDRYYHWASQVLPPLCLLFILSDHGPGMWFLLGIAALCALISLISLTAKAFKFQDNRDRMIRPTLTILIYATLQFLASYSYSVAFNESQSIFETFSEACTSVDNCTANLADWTLLPDGRYRKRVGDHITYILFYRRKARGFELYLYESLDSGEAFSKEW